MSFVATSGQLPQWAKRCPTDWRCDWLKWHVCLNTKRPSGNEAERLPYISNEDIESWTGRLLTDNPQPSGSEGRLFQVGDVLFNKLRPYLAKVYRAGFDGISSGELLCLNPSPYVVSRYLFYVLVSRGFIDTVNSETFGSKMPRADWEVVGHQPLPLPHLKIQRRIARFLDAKTARIDALIDKKRALLDRLAEKRQALITHAVTKGLNSDAPMKDSGIDWLGEIPAHWDVAPLYSRYEVALGKMLDEGAISGNWLSHYLRNVDVQWDSISTIDLPKMDIHPHEVSRYTVRNGDLLVCEGGEVGRAAIVDKGASGLAYQKALHRLRPYQATENSRFVYYALQCAADLGVFVAGGNPNTIAHLTGEKLRQHRFAFPSSTEQSAIVEYLDDAVGRVDEAADKIDTSLVGLEEYRAALITAAVTGQLDIDDAAADSIGATAGDTLDAEAMP